MSKVCLNLLNLYLGLLNLSSVGITINECQGLWSKFIKHLLNVFNWQRIPIVFVQIRWILLNSIIVLQHTNKQPHLKILHLVIHNLVVSWPNLTCSIANHGQLPICLITDQLTPTNLDYLRTHRGPQKVILRLCNDTHV